MDCEIKNEILKNIQNNFLNKYELYELEISPKIKYNPFIKINNNIDLLFNNIDVNYLKYLQKYTEEASEEVKKYKFKNNKKFIYSNKEIKEIINNIYMTCEKNILTIKFKILNN